MPVGAGLDNLIYNNSGQSQDPEKLAISGTNVQEVSITDLISEGPIEGLVNGEASIYLAGDQLSSVDTAASSSITPNDDTSEEDPSTITIPAASAVNQPVTTTLKNAAGTTTYLTDQAVTADDATKFRWLTVFSAKSHKVRVVEFFPAQETGNSFYSGSLKVVAWDVSAQGFFTDTFREQTHSKWGPTLRNLKAIVRLVTSAGQTMYGDIDVLYNDTACTQVNSGSNITVRGAGVRLWRVYRNSRIEDDVWVDSSNEVTIDCFIDYVALAEIKLDNSNKVIYIPKWTDKLGALTNKKFSLSHEITTKDIEYASANGTAENIKKYPGSSFEFRVGDIEQIPLDQLGGVGVASFPVTLTQAQAEVFNNTNSMPAGGSFSAGYPTTSELTTLVNNGAIQKNIVFSESFSGAQINEIDEIKIHFEFPGGHYAAMNDGKSQASGAAFNIKVFGSETGGTDPEDWADLTAGEFNYHILAWGAKKTAVSYIVTISVSTHLRIRDLKLQITRLTPNGQSRGGAARKLVKNKFISDWDVAVADQEVSGVVDDVKISQIIATIKEKLSYPYSAVASVNFSSKSFPNPPKRAYHVRGIKVAIPGNYTPRHLSDTGKAKYTGIWNGEFSNEGTSNVSGLALGKYYTDNPAWVLYDVLVNNRYGLGKWLTSQDINPYQLYRIAKYCDEEVPTIYGGVEPRFTANLYLTKAMEAYKVIKDMATIFRGMIYWLDGQLHATPDMPGTPIYNFSLDNIIEDTLSTESTGSKTRANQYTVVWNNPKSGYKLEPLVIEDKQNILQTGRIINKKSIAFGCTSEGQAIRMGRWKAWTAVHQTEVVKFKTSINASFLTPGNIINVQDVNDTGIAFSGRITASTNSAISLDKDIATISDEAQTDGGRTRQFEFGTTGNGFAYKLALLVLVRKVISAQDAPIVVTHSGTTYTYNRGDEVAFAKVNGTSTVLIGGSDSDEQVEKNILNVEDDAGNLVILQFENATTVETKDFDSTDVSVVNGVTQIAISSAFSGTIPSHTVWSIREIQDGANTKPSYKEYKILSIKEDNDKNWDISAVEFYNSKYDAVDKDFVLAVQDPVFPPEPDYVPAPGAVYLLNDSDWRSELEELVIQWEAPRNEDGTLYESISEFAIHVDPPLPDGTELIEIKNPRQQTYRLVNIPNGVFNFGVQTFSAETHKRSRIKWAGIDIYDKFKVSCPRTKEGVPSGIRANTKGSKAKNDSTATGTTWSLATKDWAFQSPGAPETTVNNANQSTAATYQQVLTTMATTNKEITAAFIYFDADATTDYFKLVTHTVFNCENTTLKYWQEYDQFVSNSENVWTDCTNSADARVKLHKYSNKVEKSEGTTAFTTRFQVGDVIRIKTASNTYYGGKVAFIENDDVLFTDVQLNGTNADLTSVDEAKAIARNALRPDVAKDAIIARIDRSGSNYTHTMLNWIEDTTLQGLRALIVDSNVAFLNYNSSSVLQNEIAITLTADALAYDDPEFIITGNGFTQGSPAVSGSAQSSYIDSSNSAVTAQTLTWQIHDGSGGIGYDSGSSLDFSVTVREATDESESKTKDFKIVKVQDGSIGLDGKTARLDLSDYSLLYDNEGQAPKFTGTTSVGGTVGEVALNAPLGTDNSAQSETNGWIKITVNTTNFTDPVFRIYYGSSPTYLVDSITQYSGWMDGTAGASTVVHYPVPTGYSTPITSGSININVDVAEKPANFNNSNLPASGDIKATDSCSLISVKAGEVGRTISVSNPTHVFQAENDGTVESETKTGSGTTIEFLKGGRTAKYVGGTGSHSYNSGSSPSPNEWRIKSAVSTDTHLTVGTPTGVSNNIVTIGDHAVTGGIDDTETITYTIELGTAAGVKEYKAVQVFAKAKAGETPNNTGIVYMYKVASSTPTIGSDFPNVTVGLTGTNSGKITSATNNQIGSTGWFIVPQNPGTDDLYVVAATFNGTGSSDTIAYSEWTGATIISGTDGSDGAAGTHGLSTGVATLYKRTNSDSVPAGPDGNLTYTFSTAAVSGSNFNGWSATAQSPDNSNKFQWRTTAAAIATATASTDTIASNEWSAATISAQYVKGDEGDAGQRSIQGYIYFRVADGASNPFPNNGTGTYTFSSGGLTALSPSVTYSNSAYEIEVAGDYDYYAARYYGLEATGGPHSTIAVTVTAAVAHTSFTGVVTFNSGTNLLQLNGNDLTTIDGASITTGILRSAGTNTTSATGSAFTGNNAHAYFNLTNGAIATNNFRVQTNGDAEFKGSIQATGGYIGSNPGAGWRVVGYNLMGGGFVNSSSQKTYDTTSAGYVTNNWPNANVTLDSNNARIIIRETTSTSAGVNRVTLGNLS